MTNKFRIDTRELPSCHNEADECPKCGDTGIIEIIDIRGVCHKYCDCMYGERAEEENKLGLDESED